MSYGFQFFNNSDELVIDDTAPKPWFAGKGTYVSAEVSALYAITGYTVYKLTYTTPSGGGNGGIVYISWPPNRVEDVSYCLESTEYTSGQNVIIYAAVNNNYSPTDADIPQVFCFSTGYITNYTGGWGAKIFDATGNNCVFDADARHLKLDASSDNAGVGWGGGSALYVAPSTSPSSPYSKTGVGGSIELPAFLTPKIEAEELVNNGDGTFTRNTYLAFFNRFNAVISVWQPKVRSQLRTGTLPFTGSRLFNNKNFYDLLVQTNPVAYISPLVIDYTSYDPSGTVANWPQASYALTLTNAISGGNSVDENFGLIQLNVTTTNINPGTVLRYVFSGTNITAGDFSSGSLEGTFSVGSTGTASVVVGAKNDNLFETNEVTTCTITRVNGSAITGTPATITIIEGATTYSVYTSTTSVNEGTSFTITCSASNFKQNANGLVQTVNYTLSQPSGTSFDANDWTEAVTLGSGSSVAANKFIFADGSYTASRTFYTRADFRTDGNKVLRLTIDGNSASNATVDVTINDTSQDYTWTVTGPTSVNEGSTYTYTATTNGPVGSTAEILLLAPATANFEDISLVNGQPVTSGTSYLVTTTINSGSNSVGTFTVSYKADFTTEGSEYFTLGLGKSDGSYTGIPLTTLSGVVNIVDTSLTPETWSLTAVSGNPNTTQVREGTVFTALLTSNNIPSYPRTVIYKFTGVSEGDILYDGNTATSGITTITSNSQNIQFTIREDFTTESDETVSLQFYSDNTLPLTPLGNSISWTIHDTIQLSRLFGYVTEGFAESITISSYGLNYPATVYGRLSGTNITNSDFTGSTTDVEFSLAYQGAINFTVGATADFIAEGIETVTLTLYTDFARTIQAGNTVSWNIYDTTTTITAVSGTPSTSNVNEGASLYYNLTTDAPLPRYFYAVLTGISGSDITLNTTEIASYISYSGQQDFITMTADQLTEGTEYVSMQYYYDTAYTRPAGNAITWQINDTSTTPVPVYAFTTSPASGNINEGTLLGINWSFSNVPSYPVTLYYLLTGSGITGGDTSFTNTSGNYSFTSANGTDNLGITADLLTEGTETATLTWYLNSNYTGQVGNPISITINDTSVSYPAAGTVNTSSCSGYSYTVVYNDGSGGTYSTTTNYSTNCGWTTPSLSSVLASPTYVSNGSTFTITANLNHITDVTQTVNIYYSLTGFTNDTFYAAITIPAGSSSGSVSGIANTYAGTVYITGSMASEGVNRYSYMNWN